jgi:hypothetical protein
MSVKHRDAAFDNAGPPPEKTGSKVGKKPVKSTLDWPRYSS